MAKKSDGKMHRIYFEALKALGQKVTERQRTSTLQKLWKNLRKDYQTRGETPPNLYTTAKEYREFDYDTTPRDENMQTEPVKEDLDEVSAQRVIDEFLANVKRVYDDTLAYIAENTAKGTNHDKGQLASIADYRRAELDAQYYEIIALVSQLQFQYGNLATAEAIYDNRELDYKLAISLSPPSDLIIEFEETISFLLGIMAQIEKRADELAIQEQEKFEKGSNYT